MEKNRKNDMETGDPVWGYREPSRGFCWDNHVHMNKQTQTEDVSLAEYNSKAG